MKQLKKKLLTGASRVAITAAALLGGVLLLPPSDTPFDDQADYGPNAVQQNFLRLLAEKNDYVALGDTNHTQTEFHLFAFDARTIEALHDGGARNYFIENATHQQPAMTRAKIDIRYTYNYGSRSSWTCDQKRKDAATSSFNAANRQYRDFNIVAVDQRTDPFKDMNIVQRTLYALPLQAYNLIHGCVRSPAFFVSDKLTLGTATDNLMQAITDDRKPVSVMERHQGKGAILYGAEHFRGSDGNELNMRQLLKNAGKSIVVVDIFLDAATGTEKIAAMRQGRKPDALLFISENKDYPDGIKILNPEIRPLYEAAKKAAAPILTN